MSVLNSIIIPRASFEEKTLAILTFEYNKTLTITEARDLFSSILTQWAKETEAGDKAYEYSCSDYNIGDFATDYGDEDLIFLFTTAGVRNISVSTLCNEDFSGSWNYDSVLMDSSILDNEEE